ncbi:MAG: hypothetical protein J7L86_03430 [Candidatus Marinimicrobia bacterium]|nr:hypothetical protein [Candidatus Neomarinimicrobiota bacterium]
MIKGVIQLLLILFIAITSSIAQSAQITVESQVDTTIATIGDKIHLMVTIQYPPAARFELPLVEERLGDWEVVGQHLGDPQKIKDGFRQTWNLELTVFDTGSIVIPEMEIRAYASSDSTAMPLVFKTNAETINVISVLPPGTVDPKDIKPPFPIRRIIPWNIIIFILLILAIIISGVVYYKRWRARQLSVPLHEDYLEPPHVVALRKLKELKEKIYRTDEEIRQYHFSMSEIIREYLERRYFIRALEMTTREIYEALSELNIEPEIISDFSELSQKLDLVKFAKQIPSSEMMFTLWDIAYNCVDKTKHEPFLNRRLA